MAKTLFTMGIVLCTFGALLVSVLATPILRLIYGVSEGRAGGATENEVAMVLVWLIWQAPLFFLELYATTWLLVVLRASAAFGLALLHVLLLVLLLPLGASFAGAMGGAWGTLAAQGIAAAVAFWLIRKLMGTLRIV